MWAVVGVYISLGSRSVGGLWRICICLCGQVCVGEGGYVSLEVGSLDSCVCVGGVSRCGGVGEGVSAGVGV